MLRSAIAVLFIGLVLHALSPLPPVYQAISLLLLVLLVVFDVFKKAERHPSDGADHKKQ